MKTIEVLAPGSCGELVQGTIDGRRLHVSCPVDLFSRARVRISSTPTTFAGLMPKTVRAARAAWRRSGCRPENLRLEIDSQLEPGKGMASSTADITAAAVAVGLAAGRVFTAGQLARLALEIEPTDGTLFQGIVAFDHRNGRWLRQLGPAPSILVTYIDTGGSVDTIEFNRGRLRYTAWQRRQMEIAFEMVGRGLKSRDCELVGKASTISARVNQEILPKPGLDEIIDISATVGGFGVVVAHSGSVAGILHNKEAGGVERALARMGAGAPTTVKLIDGGWRSRFC